MNDSSRTFAYGLVERHVCTHAMHTFGACVHACGTSGRKNNRRQWCLGSQWFSIAAQIELAVTQHVVVDDATRREYAHTNAWLTRKCC